MNRSNNEGARGAPIQLEVGVPGVRPIDAPLDEPLTFKLPPEVEARLDEYESLGCNIEFHQSAAMHVDGDLYKKFVTIFVNDQMFARVTFSFHTDKPESLDNAISTGRE